MFAKEIQYSMRNHSKPDLRKMFYKTVEGWETKVYFRGTIRTIQGHFIRLTVQPYGSGKELYALVSRGARPHEIVPRNAEFLRFKQGYRAATVPYWINSRRKQRFGDTIMTKRVRHPGFEGRNWDYEIALQHEPRFIRYMEQAVRRYERKQALLFKDSQITETPIPVSRG